MNNLVLNFKSVLFTNRNLIIQNEKQKIKKNKNIKMKNEYKL